MAHSNEYISYIHSTQWYDKRAKCQSLTANHCILFPWLKSRHCHHLTYKNLTREVPLRDIVPLSKTAHTIIHWHILWKIKQVRFIVNLILRALMIVWVAVWFIFR
jgi:hypothetical protein